MERCKWAESSDLMIAYHDREWGVPVHDDRQLFGKLMLDGFQAGLSWAIILRKRDTFLEAFDGFDPERMARYDRRRIAKLLKNPGIIRNRQKIESSVRIRPLPGKSIRDRVREDWGTKGFALAEPMWSAVN